MILRILCRHEKNELFSIIRGTEAWLASRIKEWNSLRLKDFSEVLINAVRSDPVVSGIWDEEIALTDEFNSITNPPPQSEMKMPKASNDGCDENQDGFDNCHEGKMRSEKTPSKEIASICRPRKIRRLSNPYQLDSISAPDQSDIPGSVVEVDGSERNVGHCDFPSQVVKLAACASCLGSMLNLSISEFPWPYYFISTRDCFKHQLLPIRTKVTFRQ